MQSISDIFPSSDTLDRITGVENQLRRRRRIGGLGWALLILGSTVQIFAEINNLGILALDELWESNPWLAGGLIAAAFVTILSLLLITWSTYWLKASKRPFRYICSVGEFKPVTKQEGGAPQIADAMNWLPQDLQRFLNERVQRFDFLESGTSGDAQPDSEAGSDYDSHIHIHGHYMVRSSGDCADCVEVASRIRIGPPGSPEVLAPTPPPVNIGSNPDSSRRDYDDLLERVYHSIVSEVYQRLQEDVQRKIDLLPTRKLRVIALLHEADDYAQSNTLHAYDQAAELYSRAAEALEVSLRKLPEGWFRRMLLGLRGRISSARRAIRRFESRLRPRVAEIDVLLARAMIGYALMQNIRLSLRGLVGARSPIMRFEPIRYIDRAYDCLMGLGDDVPGRKDSLFSCLAVMALAYKHVGHQKKAESALEEARSLDPARATDDQIYLFVSARIAGETRTRLSTLRHAVELDPRFELAQFDLAYETEMLWRSRETFEAAGAESVLDKYNKVTNINPGNLGGWANSGHACWLIGDLEKARSRFEQGIRYREVQKDAYVSELQYGLARICAEEGKIEDAYRYYVDAVSSMISGDDYGDYFFETMTPATLQRYKNFYLNFVEKVQAARNGTGKSSANETEARRLRNSVHAFVLYDLGRALNGASDRFETGKYELAQAAMRKFRAASRRNADFALPHFWIGVLTSDSEESRERLEKAIELEKDWSNAVLHLIYRYAIAARDVEERRSANQRLPLELKEKRDRRDELIRIANRDSPLRRSASAGTVDSSRRASDAIRHQYDLKDDEKQPESAQREARAAQVEETERQFTASKETTDEILRLNSEIMELEAQLRSDDALQSEGRAKAEHYRRIAEEKVRQLMPHEWLWDQDKKFNWDAVTDPVLRKYMVWEREFSRGHVEALHLWALRFVHDDEVQHENAAKLLELLGDLFWPASSDVLEPLLKVRLRQTRNPLVQMQLIKTITAQSPGIIRNWRDLEEFGFTLDQEIELLSDLHEQSPDSATAAEIAKRLADALYRKADEESPEEARRDLGKALDVQQPPEQRAKLLLKLARNLLGSDDAGSAAEALEYMTEAETIRGYPNNDLTLRALPERLNLRKARSDAALWWGGSGAHFMDLKPAVHVKLSQDLHASLGGHRADEGAASQTLDDLQWGLYWELGVLFPRPVIDTDDGLESNHFSIDLFGVEWVSGRMRVDQRLVSVAQPHLSVLNIPSEPAVNPANGRDCALVDASTYDEHRDLLEEFGHTWDVFGFVVLHIANIMRKNAAEFVRIDSVAELLQLHGLKSKLDEFEEDERLIELTGVMRAFAAEEIPVIDLPQLVQIFEDERPRHSGLTELAEAIRMHPDYRRRNKYVSQPRRMFLPLGPNFTRAMADGLKNGDGRVLAMKPEVVQELLAAVRYDMSQISPEDPNPVILARSDIRVWVKRLVELEYPNLWVLSDKEALPEHLNEIGGEIETL